MRHDSMLHCHVALCLTALLACSDAGSGADGNAGADDAGQPGADAGPVRGAAGAQDATAEDMDRALAGLLGGDGPSYGEVNVEAMREILETPPEEDGPFYMVNYIEFREQAVYADGRETDLTGREADAMYAPLEFLEAIGAEVVFVAAVEVVLPLGDGTQWDQVAIVRYPSRAKFAEMIMDPEFQARSVHKDAGLEKSIVLVTEPIELPALEPSEPAYPATEEDPPFEMIHLFDYHDVAQYEDGADEPERSGRDAVQLYQSNAGSVAVPLGVYPRAWFEVKATLIGDGREWEEVRINHFPSHATFEALTSDETWQSGTHHRRAGLADTYALQTAAAINRL